jgi:hypothetical protein
VAVTHNQKGDPTTLVVDANNKVVLRSLVTERAIGDKWLVTDGVKAGDRVIVEGVQFAKPGAVVKPEELQSTAAGAAPAAGAPTPAS